MIVCLVTDGRRLCGPDRPFETMRQCLLEQARFAVDAGIDLFQVRERELEAGDLARLAADVVRLAAGSRTRVVVNDRLDVALASGAAGVHLRSDSMPADAVRRLAPPGFLVGRSVHRADEAVAAGKVDYLVAGTVFASASKPPGSPVIGLAGLAEIVEAVEWPVLAIGGMSIARAAEVAAAGAAGLAAVELFIGQTVSDDPCRATPLGALVSAIRSGFDGG